MPARTRLIKQALIIFAIIFLGFFAARTLNGTDTPSYELSNSVDLSKDGIATNSRLKGEQLPNIELENVDGETTSTKSLLGTPTILNIWYSTCEPCRRESWVGVIMASTLEGRISVGRVGHRGASWLCLVV